MREREPELAGSTLGNLGVSQGTKKAAPASPSPGLARKCFGIHIDAASAAIEDNQCTWCFVKYVDTAMYRVHNK